MVNDIDDNVPPRLRLLLSHFDLTRGRKEKRGWVLPNPSREDNNPSVWVSLTEDRILIKDRTGRPTLDILNNLGMTWPDLYAADDLERLEFANYLQSLSGGASAAVQPTLDDTQADLRHKVYSSLLGHLALSDAHYQQLTERGLPPETIDQNGYRTLRVVDRGKTAAKLFGEFGGIAGTVPGITPKGTGLTLCDAPGLLIPVRDLKGRITSLKVRRDKDQPRYRWFGEGDVLAAHHTIGFPPATLEVVVTEGELKADVAATRLTEPIMSVPGMGQWKLALPTLRAVGAKTVILAFDRDPIPERQAEIDHNADEFADCLFSQGYTVEELLWEVQ